VTRWNFRHVLKFAVVVFLTGSFGNSALAQKKDEPPKSQFQYDPGLDKIEGGQEALKAQALERHVPPLKLTPPTDPVKLVFQHDQPVRYLITSVSRMGIKDRPGLRQVHETTHAVTYTPLEKMDNGHVRMEVGVDVAWGRYNEPLPFDQARGRDLLRQARFRYTIDEHGKIDQVEIDGLTDPLARPSLEHMANFAKSMQPPLPQTLVKPGDFWTQTFSHRDEEGIAHLAGDTKNTYTLKAWRPCRGAMCAFIEIKQEIKSAGKLMDRNMETRGAGVGTGAGWMLFDFKKGQVVKSKWTMVTESWVKVLIDGQDKRTAERGPEARIQVEVESTAERIDGPQQSF
jgi:hypothetical protein